MQPFNCFMTQINHNRFNYVRWGVCRWQPLVFDFNFWYGHFFKSFWYFWMWCLWEIIGFVFANGIIIQFYVSQGANHNKLTNVQSELCASRSKNTKVWQSFEWILCLNQSEELWLVMTTKSCLLFLAQKLGDSNDIHLLC